jgi:hypothetical protein
MKKFMIFAVGAALLGGTAQAQTVVPNDALPTCALNKADFNKWKATSTAFNAANSTTFDDSSDCNFYKWGSQMFLWITSPLNGGLVYDGDDFLDIVTDASEPEYMQFASSSDTGVGKFAVRSTKDDDTAVSQTGGGGVLISKDNGIVYYGVKTNNVYAYYRTGQFGIEFDDSLQNSFPTDANDLAAIQSYVKGTFGIDEISNGIALAMELKSSWVVASTLGTIEDVKKSYITSEAEIVTFDTSNDKKWPKSGTSKELMALVGMHVVGSVKGHPEMVWATFEHINNAPQNNYAYVTFDTQNPFIGVKNIPYDGVKNSSWTFNSRPVVNADDLPVRHLNERAQLTGDAIEADGADNTIGPNQVVRLNAWGDAPPAIPTKTVTPEKKMTMSEYANSGISTPLSRATDLISLNSSIMGFLGKSDVRSNYIQTGAIWSTGAGHIPTSGTDPELRGNLQLANSTMETYHQYPDSHSTTSSPKNCFGCHSVQNQTVPSVNVSHIISNILPLNPNP